jgi:hypothetical protein
MVAVLLLLGSMIETVPESAAGVAGELVLLWVVGVDACAIRVSFALAMINSLGIKLVVVSGLLVLQHRQSAPFVSCDPIILLYAWAVVAGKFNCKSGNMCVPFTHGKQGLRRVAFVRCFARH